MTSTAIARARRATIARSDSLSTMSRLLISEVTGESDTTGDTVVTRPCPQSTDVSR